MSRRIYDQFWEYPEITRNLARSSIENSTRQEIVQLIEAGGQSPIQVMLESTPLDDGVRRILQQGLRPRRPNAPSLLFDEVVLARIGFEGGILYVTARRFGKEFRNRFFTETNGEWTQETILAFSSDSPLDKEEVEDYSRLLADDDFQFEIRFCIPYEGWLDSAESYVIDSVWDDLVLPSWGDKPSKELREKHRVNKVLGVSWDSGGPGAGAGISYVLEWNGWYYHAVDDEITELGNQGYQAIYEALHVNSAVDSIWSPILSDSELAENLECDRDTPAGLSVLLNDHRWTLGPDRKWTPDPEGRLAEELGWGREG